VIRAIGPRGGWGPDVAVPFLVLGLCWLPVAGLGTVWTGGHLASWLSGHGWHGPAFGWEFARQLLTAGGISPARRRSPAADRPAQTGRSDITALWPGVPVPLIWTCVGLVLAAVGTLAAAAVAAWLRWQASAADPVRSLATTADLADLAPARIGARARRLRPSLARGRRFSIGEGQQLTGGEPSPAARRLLILAGRSLRTLPRQDRRGLADRRGRLPVRSGRPRLTPSELGVPLGRLRLPHGLGPQLRASWEDVVLAVMAPRAGKTTALAIPAVLEAPGAVVATSNKADLWTATAELRARTTGQRVWVFDPQRIVHAERTWWWNPLRDLTSVEEAHRFAGHFVAEIRGGREDRDFWTAAAHDLLTGLVLAAALSGQSLVEVYEWLNDPVVPTPVEVLRQHGRQAVAASLLGRMHGAPETRDGVYETARTAAQCLRDDAILAWVTPARSSLVGVPARGQTEEFDAAGFAMSRQSLYLLSRDGAGAAAPIVAALTDRVMREATRAAERAGGRLDPPLLTSPSSTRPRTSAGSPTCPSCTPTWDLGASRR